MVESIVKIKKPSGDDWTVLSGRIPSLDELGYPYAGYQHIKSGVTVVSAIEVAGNEDRGPEYHISVSQYQKRCDSNTAKWVKKQFGMLDSEEDNHVPNGFVRNFWMPVAENLIGHECPCKETETAVKEDKGDFVWRGINK